MYDSYRQKMEENLEGIGDDMNAVFQGLQQTTASLQQTLARTQEAVESLEGFRVTLGKWTEECMRRR